jgi:hypothetical protein
MFKKKPINMKTEKITQITYQIVVEQNANISMETMSFERLFLNDIAKGYDFEFVYALSEIAEDVMKLNAGESMYFKPNRDEPSKGIIARIL